MAEQHDLLDVERVTIATVVDERPPYLGEVVHLFRSLALFGGGMARAQRRAYFINGVSGDAERELAELDVEVRVVPEVEPRFRFANKLVMFAGEAGGDADLLVAIDSDVVVAGDFSPHLVPGLLQAKQPDGDLLTFEMWEQLFARFDLQLPDERHPTSLDPHWTHAYFNSGVVFVPGDVLQPLHDAWLRFIRAQLDMRDLVPGLAEHLEGRIPSYEGATEEGLEHLFFAEQWAFALARHALRLPYAVLPLALNFPTITREDQEPGAYIQDRFMPHAIRPLLIHHHHHLDGGLRPTGYEQPDAVIRDVNDALFAAGARGRVATAAMPR